MLDTWDKEETRYNLGADIVQLGRIKRRLFAQGDLTKLERERITARYDALMNELDDASTRRE